jgi:3-methylcrotonyl-CoA carboxylase beta subunit
MWPNARISVMGGEQAAQVLATVRSDGYKTRGETWDEGEKQAFIDDIRSRYDTQGHPYYATARLWDDGVIDPLDTRKTLGTALLAAAYGPPPGEERYGVFRM